MVGLQFLIPLRLLYLSLTLTDVSMSFNLNRFYYRRSEKLITTLFSSCMDSTVRSCTYWCHMIYFAAVWEKIKIHRIHLSPCVENILLAHALSQRFHVCPEESVLLTLDYSKWISCSTQHAGNINTCTCTTVRQQTTEPTIAFN